MPLPTRQSMILCSRSMLWNCGRLLWVPPKTKKKGRFKIYHIPLDAHVSSLLRGTTLWEKFGHLHMFTIETAQKALEHTGHRIVDLAITDGALQVPRYGRLVYSTASAGPSAQ